MRSFSALLSLIDSGCRGFDKPLSQVLPRGLDYFYQRPRQESDLVRKVECSFFLSAYRGSVPDHSIPTQQCLPLRLSSENYRHTASQGVNTYDKPKLAAAVSTMALPIIREAVAAGDGTFITCSTLPDGTNWKSSTRAPSDLSA
jgi:hypothetical protein